MTRKLIHSTNLLQDGLLHQNAWVLFTDSKSKVGEGIAWQQEVADEIIDGSNQILHSGLFDTHCHGGNGFSANNGVEDIRHILDFNQSNQVNRNIISLVSASIKDMVEVANQCKQLEADPRFLGLHFEGPFLSQQHKGAQDPEAIKKATDQEIEMIVATGTVFSITVAPEAITSSQLKTLEEAGIKLCFGHSSEGYGVAKEFFETHPGSVMTHTFNGMQPIHHRAPGPVPAAIESETFMELIADGIHVHPGAALLIPSQKIILVTDAINATGMQDGNYKLGDVAITVRDSIARTEEGSLAGSTLKLKDAVKNYATWTKDSQAAILAATAIPARAYGAKLARLSIENHFLLSL